MYKQLPKIENTNYGIYTKYKTKNYISGIYYKFQLWGGPLFRANLLLGDPLSRALLYVAGVNAWRSSFC